MRVNYRQVLGRFGHIDGRIVSAQVTVAPESDLLNSRVVVRFYPWWEHPMYVTARDAGKNWGFSYDEGAERDVVIEAVSPWRCNVRSGTSAVDISFNASSPLLWEIEDHAQIDVNSDFDHRELLQKLSERLGPGISFSTLLKYISPYPRYRAPYSLGYFPYTLFCHVRDQLTEMGVQQFVTHEPKPPQKGVVLSIDDNIIIAAEDFFLDVPQFEHRPEWFQPNRGG